MNLDLQWQAIIAAVANVTGTANKPGKGVSSLYINSETIITPSDKVVTWNEALLLIFGCGKTATIPPIINCQNLVNGEKKLNAASEYNRKCPANSDTNPIRIKEARTIIRRLKMVDSNTKIIGKIK